MSSRVIFIFSVLLLLTPLIVTNTTGAEQTIEQHKSGDYFYEIHTKNESDSATYWTIGNKETSSEITENAENGTFLNGFRNSVNRMETLKGKVILYGLLSFVIFITLILTTKSKRTSKKVPIILMAGLGIYAISMLTLSTIHLYEEYEKANHLLQFLQT